MITDIERVRLSVVGPSGVKVKMSMIFKLLKDIIGKDLSKFSMPVFVNEPTSSLQKVGEFMFLTHFFKMASIQESSIERMKYLTIYECCTPGLLLKRLGKPFNPLLGETYELVTS
jgi:hypothetical protein